MSEVIELVADDQRDRAERRTDVVGPASRSAALRIDGAPLRWYPARALVRTNGCRRTTICDAMR